MHILTIEDPIEYLHNHKVAMVNPARSGAPDVTGFTEGSAAHCAKTPDVILLGEMR